LDHCILIADDAAMNRMLVKKILSRSFPNASFVEAKNGLEVMTTVESKNIDLIILDLIMPNMDGYETLKWLKSSNHHSIPVIVNSSITEIASIESTLKIGAMDYFTKPLSPDDMNIILPLKAKNALILHDQTKTIQDLNDRIQKELKSANYFANIMLPKSNKFKTIDLYIKYQPSLGIGGDIFDCVELSNGDIHFMVADVTGHGIAAGMTSSMVKILYRKGIEQVDHMPHEILETMNHSIFEYFDFEDNDNYFTFTAFVGLIRKGKLYYANAGQPYPLVYHCAADKLNFIDQNGFIIGMMDEINFETKQLNLYDNDMIFLYTDGLFSAGKDSDFAKWREVYEIANGLKHKLAYHPKIFLDDILYAFYMIHKSSQSDFTDDVAMMVIKQKGNR